SSPAVTAMTVKGIGVSATSAYMRIKDSQAAHPHAAIIVCSASADGKRTLNANQSRTSSIIMRVVLRTTDSQWNPVVSAARLSGSWRADPPGSEDIRSL